MRTGTPWPLLMKEPETVVPGPPRSPSFQQGQVYKHRASKFCLWLLVSTEPSLKLYFRSHVLVQLFIEHPGSVRSGAQVPGASLAGGGGVSPREQGQASLTGAPEQRNEEAAGRPEAHFPFQERELHAEAPGRECGFQEEPEAPAAGTETFF